MRWIKISILASVAVVLVALAVLAFPKPLFAHRHVERNFEVWSDQPIGAEISQVLNDAERRLRTSPLYDSSLPVRIFICNADWRLRLYSQRLSARLGGVADTWLTHNVYLRRADIAGNRLVSPSGGDVTDAAVRPLSYFIAHEVSHILVARRYGRLVGLSMPTWLMEGYADYVGKGGDFDVQENLALLQAGDARLDPALSGLYRRHHLAVALLVDRHKMPLERLFNAPPDEEAVLRDILID
jgi:hypothetical protein